jgi:hypothetical protein
MNERLHSIMTEAGYAAPEMAGRALKLVELVKQAIYDDVKEELIPDDVIAEEKPQFQEYLKGCNSGTVDALCHIKNFGVDIND